MRVLLVVERSGGHIFPALTFAKKISETGQNEIYFFSGSSFLREHIKKEGYQVVGRVFLRRNILIDIFWRLPEAVYLLWKIRPQRVIGFGGRESFFPVLLAAIFNCPSEIYEANSKFGKANRILSLFASRVMWGFNRDKTGKKEVAVRIPLRENLKKINQPRAREILGLADMPTLLCFGGSQGSRFINRTLLKFLRKVNCNLQVIHLTGRDDFFEISQLYNKIRTAGFVRDFYSQMEVAYSAADFAICRSGASALAEISFYGLASVLIPHPQAGGHQKDNALYFQSRGAAFVCRQNNFSFDDFSRYLMMLINDRGLRQAMGRAASKVNLGVEFESFAIPDCL